MEEHTVDVFFKPALDLECSGCPRLGQTEDEEAPTHCPLFQHLQADSFE